MRLKAVLSMYGLCMVTHLPPADAQIQPDYRCTIERIDTSSVKSSSMRKFEEDYYVSKQFTVERRTGLMAGVLKNSYVTKPVVIDHGSIYSSYKVITTMHREEGTGAASNIYALTIDEFERSPKKPFVFLENDIVYFGQCEHI